MKKWIIYSFLIIILYFIIRQSREHYSYIEKFGNIIEMGYNSGCKNCRYSLPACSDGSCNNEGALARYDLQSGPKIDLNMIDWSKIDDSTYTKVIMALQQREEVPIIKNLPIFN
jgi:hypothetical protein